jgi:hypothetical protein
LLALPTRECEGLSWALAGVFWLVGFPYRLSFFPAELARFCTDLEKAVISTVEQGHMTKDLAICVHGTTKVGGPAQHAACADHPVHAERAERLLHILSIARARGPGPSCVHGTP